MSYTICNNPVSTEQLTIYRTTITKIFNDATTASTSNGSVIDAKTIINSAITELQKQNKDMSNARKIVNDCINNFKDKLNQPETNYDNKNTSYLMFQNSRLLHQEIIYNRIQLIIYIALLLSFFYIKVK